MIPSDDEVRGAVSIVQNDYDSYDDGSEYKSAIKTLLSLASAYLAVEGVPEKKPSNKGHGCKCNAYYSGECGCGVDWSDNDGFNEALSLCRAVIVRKDMAIAQERNTILELDREISELKKELNET